MGAVLRVAEVANLRGADAGDPVTWRFVWTPAAGSAVAVWLQITILERGEHLVRRKRIYEALHPEVKRSSSEQMSKVRRGEMISSRQDSFAADTSKKTGLTPRTIQHEV